MESFDYVEPFEGHGEAVVDFRNRDCWAFCLHLRLCGAMRNVFPLSGGFIWGNGEYRPCIHHGGT